MNKRNSGGGNTATAVILFSLSLAATGIGLATIALAYKDQQIASLTQWAGRLEAKHHEFLSAILACANGDGFTMDLARTNMVYVSCTIEYEYVNGRYYEKDSARTKKIRK